MKTIILFGAILFLTLSSCHRSSHCIINDGSGNTIKDYGVKKGTSKDVKSYENSCISDAQQYNGTLSCNGMMMH